MSKKIIINDYTKKSAFNFYRTAYGDAITRNETPEKKYSTIIDGEPVKRFYINQQNDTEINPFHFGDSYYKQIFDVIGANLFTYFITHDNYATYTAFDHYSKNEKLTDNYLFENIDEYWNFLKKYNIERREPNSRSIFYKKLTNPEWQLVLILFSKDINDIIINEAPTVNYEINYYRGVTFDYLKLIDNNKTEIRFSDTQRVFESKEGTFTSIRQGSFSFNFNKAKQYSYDKQKKQYGTIYKVTIAANTPVLYIPSLSYASDEFEILHGGYGVFSYWNETSTPSYNNINNKYGILSNENDAFKSVDIVFSGYNTGKEIMIWQALSIN